ncbi:nucleotidyltransferase domain-containing protein [Candidatus Pacearchaeota archaeon]|nr:nucleotidyltransferase domain-containing protein [Candidatus Pacearchaeota archaeon]
MCEGKNDERLRASYNHRAFIESELKQLTSVILKSKILEGVREIRVFGSYNNGNWNPEISDIDIFIEADKVHADSDVEFEHWIKHDARKSKSVGWSYLERFQIGGYSVWQTEKAKQDLIMKTMKSGRILYQNKTRPIK